MDEQRIASLSEKELFNLSLQETEPRKFHPTSPMLRKRQLRKTTSDLSDEDLFRRSLEEPEPKKLLPRNKPACSSKSGLCKSTEPGEMQQFLLNSSAQSTICTADALDIDFFRRCIGEPEPKKCVLIPSAPPSQTMIPKKAIFPADVEGDFFRRCMAEPEPRKDSTDFPSPPAELGEDTMLTLVFRQIQPWAAAMEK